MRCFRKMHRNFAKKFSATVKSGTQAIHDLKEIWEGDSGTLSVLHCGAAFGSQSAHQQRHCNPVIAMTFYRSPMHCTAIHRHIVRANFCADTHAGQFLSHYGYPICFLQPDVFQTGEVGSALCKGGSNAEGGSASGMSFMLISTPCR